jgi:hypothetical protein
MPRRSAWEQLLPTQLPFCDVLVTHEPPKGTLDLTYHGFNAGSSILKSLVDNAKEKPRLWLSGHIHESRGVVHKSFGLRHEEEYDESIHQRTIVVNAANANSGKANRLVEGAVIIDVERNRQDETETAASTIQLRQTENDDVNPDGLAGIENMTQYVARPGVRRRKGVPRRQLLK